MAISTEPTNGAPAYRVIAQSVERQILSGELKIGEVLPSELALAERLGVNRSTVREAIRLLEENGIVRRRQGGKKLFVSIPEDAKTSQRLTTSLVLQEVTFAELWDVMYALEPVAARRAASRIDSATLEALRDNIARTATNVKDLDYLVEVDLEFHRLVALASGNRALQLCRQPISGLFYPAFDAVIRRLNAGERLLAAHTKIFEAIEANDERTAEEWMRKHIVDFHRGFELANLDIESAVDPGRTPRTL